jgi:thymidylate synthase (FAD)
MRQFVRHRTMRLNEWSGRYSELKDEFYIPEAWRIQDTKNKQGSLDYDDPLWHSVNMEIAKDTFRYCYDSYQKLLERGVAKELARIVLPVSLFTEIYVNVDIHNLIHFLNLRQDPHAQLEMREIANAMDSVFQELYPWCAEARNRFKVKVVENGIEESLVL